MEAEVKTKERKSSKEGGKERMCVYLGSVSGDGGPSVRLSCPPVCNCAQWDESGGN
jgi:hypothetical protein